MSNLSLLTGLGTPINILTGLGNTNVNNFIEFTVEFVPFYAWAKKDSIKTISTPLSAGALKVRSII